MDKENIEKGVQSDRKDYQENHLKIIESFEKLYDESGKYPSLRAISKDCGLSLNAVARHCEKLTLDFIKPKYKLATERVLKRLIKKIDEEGNASEVKLFNQLVNDYKEKSGVEHSGKIKLTDLFDDKE